MKVMINDWMRVLLIPHLLFYLLLPVLAGNTLFLCVSSEDHVALEFGTASSCCSASEGDTAGDPENTVFDDQQCSPCIDFQLTGSTAKAMSGRFKTFSAPGEGLHSVLTSCPVKTVSVATQHRLTPIRPASSTHSVPSTNVLLI